MKTLAFLFAMLMVLSCKNGNEKTSPLTENISESVYASGIVKSKNQYQVYSTVNGLIQDILVHDGDVVIKGQPLIKVLNETSELNTFNSKLAMENADIYTNNDKLREAKVAINLSLSKLKNDSLLFIRQSSLWSQGIGSRVDFEQKQLAFKNSAANYETARLHYLELKRQLEFASDQSKTNLKISNVLEGDYLIKADAAGRVYKILKEKGEFVNTLNPVAIMGDANEFIIEMKVDEYDISRILNGQKILVTMDSYKGKVFEATIVNIEPLMNEQSRSFTVNAVFVSKPKVLYPNLSVEANIVIHSKVEALTIPRSYLINDSTVMLKKGVIRTVVTGLKDYQKVEILSGLSANDIIYKPIL
jgi:HlyD family secretion protein